ncbi:type II toxin-antitoxin system HicB family antitoxin [Paludibacterium paludis]|uniref:HicB-like antitoxin of toxin-antitoxin system domain-containing protein n=1 Tax=Paludibacterium paludis TaxID=1225769 RepID=A0A918NYA7_9NEIS|nr:type II toxin-antitoxin system HicB family antitoxin [Paludibacterium paludis]GGY05017.1 hypothetical protein GCM10011289_04470 [Paludibacterium paludis]
MIPSRRFLWPLAAALVLIASRSASPGRFNMQNPDYRGAVRDDVEVAMSELDAVPSRFNVSMPRFVLARHVSAVLDTRPGFLARAALEIIEREKHSHAA